MMVVWVGVAAIDLALFVNFAAREAFPSEFHGCVNQSAVID
jgi:hypothetical protein